MTYLHRLLTYILSFFTNPKPQLPLAKKLSSYTRFQRAQFDAFMDQHDHLLMQWINNHPDGTPPPIVEIDGEFRWLTRDERRKSAKQMGKR